MKRLLVILLAAIALGSCSARSERAEISFSGHGYEDHAKLADLIVEECGQ